MNIISFDPGKKGGIATHHKGITNVYPMPLAGKVLDLASIATIIKNASPDIAVIEKVGGMPGQGVASTFTFGTGYGQIQGLLAGLGIPFELVTPQAWKKLVLAGTTKDKDAAIAYCRRAFPHIPLVMPRCRTPHDGIADALCIMQFGLRNFGNSPSKNTETESRHTPLSLNLCTKDKVNCDSR
jgi:crossover junction endodeoxyribonuclease RuvC